MRDASESAWPVTTFDPDDSMRFPMNPAKGSSGLLLAHCRQVVENRWWNSGRRSHCCSSAIPVADTRRD
jgi:hypothetical protein